MHQSGMHEHIGQYRPRLDGEAGERCRQLQTLEYSSQTTVEKLQHDFQQRSEDKYSCVDVNQLDVNVPFAERFL